MTPKPQPPIPELIETRSINLLIGSSTSGKTVFLLSEIERYLNFGEFAGHKLLPGQSPVPVAMIVGAGQVGGVYQRIEEMSLLRCSDPVQFPIVEWRPSDSDSLGRSLEKVYEQVSLCARQPVRLLVIENIQSLMESSKYNDSASVTQFYSILTDFNNLHNTSILGTVGMAKQKQGERYPLLADRPFGSTAWSSGANTLIGIEQIMLHIPEERRPTARRITIQARSRPPVGFYVDFDGDGRLQVIKYEEEAPESPLFAKLDAFLETIPPGKEVTREFLLNLGEEIGASTRTVDRWIASRSSDSLGMLERVGNGRKRMYRRPIIN